MPKKKVKELHHSDGTWVPLAAFRLLRKENEGLKDQLQWSLKNEAKYKSWVADLIKENEDLLKRLTD